MDFYFNATNYDNGFTNDSVRSSSYHSPSVTNMFSEPEFWINVILACAMVSALVLILYFGYADYALAKMMEHQGEVIARTLDDDILMEKLAMDQEARTDLSTMIASSTKAMLASMSPMISGIKKTNKQIKQKAYLIYWSIFVGLMLLAFLLGYFFYKNTPGKFFAILVKNIIMVIFMGLSEVLFLTFVVEKFVPITPSFIQSVLCKILLNIKEKRHDVTLDNMMTSLLTNSVLKVRNQYVPQSSRL